MRYVAKAEGRAITLTNKWTKDSQQIDGSHFDFNNNRLIVPSKTFGQNNIYFNEIGNLKLLQGAFPEYFI